ncbi:MAG: haloacid dehalogenase domain protein hydrolase [Frankiales bacterium]|nr:haloacid dehalogenase domain protein hydrolase [Frankiales bacterium]
MEITVGFDLDLTLVDSRPSVIAVAAMLAQEYGTPIDGELWASRLGPPLEEELAHWVAPELVDEVACRYRALMAEHGVALSSPLPGAREAVAAVRRHGRAVVVTAKQAVLAEQTLAFLGIEVDAVHGWLWGDAKATALLEEGAAVYVGDHPHDVAGARAANAVSVGVRTGGSEPVGADVLLDDLTSFPEWLLLHELSQLGSLLVAFSGGADSALLLAAAVRALGADNVVAATAVSASLAQEELPAAQAYATSLGVRHLLPETRELDRQGYVANGSDRCFHCKATLLDTLRPLAADLGLAHVATGTNADDLVAGFRPGIRAAADRGAVTPLRRLTKQQVRDISHRWGLVTADKPALACLASRIAHGVEVTPQRLSRVDRAETALRAHLVPRDVRVRVLDDITARVELDPVALGRWDLTAEALVLAEGFATVETRVFRSGSMNDLIGR